MTQGNQIPPQPPRREDRRIVEAIHDPYHTRLKLSDPSACSDCGAIYHAGRWLWAADSPSRNDKEIASTTCPACQRTKDGVPAGWVTIGGSFTQRHGKEIRHLIRHQEHLEKAEHPLNRIMDIVEEDGGLLVTTTDIHLPRRIGKALQSAYNGNLDFAYQQGEYQLRVCWSRDH